MSEEIGGELVPDSTRDLDIDGELDLMIEDLDSGTVQTRRFTASRFRLQRTALRP